MSARARGVQGSYRGEGLSSLHQVPLLCQHRCNPISSIDVVLILPEDSVEVLQGLEEAVVDLLQGLCSLGVPPAPSIAALGCVLVDMELASLEVEHGFQQQRVRVMLAGRKLKHLVDVLLGFIKVFPVQMQLPCIYQLQLQTCCATLVSRAVDWALPACHAKSSMASSRTCSGMLGMPEHQVKQFLTKSVNTSCD